jgi:hypothetical protein
MTDREQIDLEQELRSAMRQHAAGLPRPRLDLRRMRRRSAARRRFAVAAAVAALALAVAAPLAVAQGMLPLTRPASSKTGGPATSTPTASTALPQSGTGQSGVVQNGTQTPPAVPGSGGHPAPSVTQPGSLPGAVAGCVTRRGPLPAGERAALQDDARKTLAEAQGKLHDQLGNEGSPRFSDDDLDHLLPATGSQVSLLDCAGERRLTDEQRADLLQQVRAAVLAAGAVSRAVTDQLTAGLGTGGMVTPEVTEVRRTADAIVVHTLLSGSAPRPQTVVTTMRLPDCAVSKVDLSGLDVLKLGPLGGFDLDGLRQRLGELGPQLPGVTPSVLTPDATLVPPSSP